MGIRPKLLLIISSITFVVLILQTYLQINLQQTALDNELHQRTSLMRENISQRAQSQAETLKHLMAEYIAAYKLFEVTTTARQTAEESSELEKVVVLDKFNQVYVDTSRPNFSGFYLPNPEFTSPASYPKNSSLKSYSVRSIALDSTEGLEFKTPIKIGEDTWGHLILVYSLGELNQKIADSVKNHQSQQEELFFKIFIITLSILFLASIVISKITSRLIAPIISLTEHTKDLAKGDFSQIKEIDQPRHDEIGELTQNFVAMAHNLEQSHKELANYNQTLEQTVNKRTYALNLKNSALKSALSKLEDSQQQLIHSEKMAALGQLISGIAHEINTPLGAIQASAGNNSKSFHGFEKNLSPFLEDISNNDKHLLTLLLQKSVSKIEQGIIYSTREERHQKKIIYKLLSKLEIIDVGAATELLLDMINPSDLDELAPYLDNEHALETIKLAYDISALERNNQTILTAISKASKVVFSLKNFSHHDNTGNKILSNINHGIKTVLVLYQNFLKQGCTVIENFEELPDILCYPDELNQVWTNLIHNALYAMQNVGIITIHTKVEDNNICVNISDNGSGIPKDIQKKVFDSFFTTKPAGEGSGLGLGICKRIIDKHKGTISLKSEPGNTCFTVILPILDE